MARSNQYLTVPWFLICFVATVAGSFTTLDGLLATLPQELTILRDALTVHGYGSALKAKMMPTTLFAPTDAAFRQFFADWGMTESQFLGDLGPPGVRCLLQYMGLDAAFTENDIKRGLTRVGRAGFSVAGAPTLSGQWCAIGGHLFDYYLQTLLSTDRSGAGQLQVEGAGVISPDHKWDYGIVHIVDQVPNAQFWLPSRARGLDSLLASRSDLSILRKVMNDVGYTNWLNQRASQVRKYTLLAPTDSAFQQFLQEWQLSESQFYAGGDVDRNVYYLISSLLLCGYGRSSDLWLGSAMRGGYMVVDTLCPCGGGVSVEGRGRSGSDTLVIANGNLISGDQSWRGGVVHVIDRVPWPSCWQKPAATAVMAVEVPPQSRITTPPPQVYSITTLSPLAAAPNPVAKTCFNDIDAALGALIPDTAMFLRSALLARGIADRLDAHPGETTFFAPTDDALWHWVGNWGLTEWQVVGPSWRGDDCVLALFKNLIHQRKLSTEELQQKATQDGGLTELQTLHSRGLEIRTSSSNHALNIGGARIVMADLQWCGGIIHVIDRMPTPSDWSPVHEACAQPKGAAPNVTLDSQVIPQLEVVEDSSTEVALAIGTVIAFVASICACVAMCLLLSSSSMPSEVVPYEKDELKKPAPLPEPKKLSDFLDKDEKFKPGSRPNNIDLETCSTCCPSEASWDTSSIASSAFGTSRSFASQRGLENAGSNPSTPTLSRQVSIRSTSSVGTPTGSTPFSARSRNWDQLSEASSMPGTPLALADSPASTLPATTLALKSPSRPSTGTERSEAEDTTGWCQLWSKSRGSCYYWNEKTGQTQWTRPRCGFTPLDSGAGQSSDRSTLRQASQASVERMLPVVQEQQPHNFARSEHRSRSQPPAVQKVRRERRSQSQPRVRERM